MQLCNVPKIAACPTARAPHATPDTFTCLVDGAMNRGTYLLVSDYYSKVPFVFVIPGSVTSTVVIGEMNKSLFAEQGVSQVVISNNVSKPFQL